MQYHWRPQSLIFQKAMMQLIVEVPGMSFSLPALVWTPSFLRRMLKNFGQQVSRSSWISLHLNTWIPGNILDDSPTIIYSQLPSSFNWFVSTVSDSVSSLGINQQPRGQKQWSQAWQMKQVLSLLRPSTMPFLALLSSLQRLFSEFVLQKQQERPLPPQILQRSLYHLSRVSFPVKHPKSTESIYSCSDLSLKSESLPALLSLEAMLFSDFSVSSPVFLNFFLMASSMELLPMRLSLSMACSTQMGSFVPRPSLENWWFQIEMTDDIPQVRLYCGRETVSQCSFSSFRGTIFASYFASSTCLSDSSAGLSSSCGSSITVSLSIQITYNDLSYNTLKPPVVWREIVEREQFVDFRSNFLS